LIKYIYIYIYTSSSYSGQGDEYIEMKCTNIQ